MAVSPPEHTREPTRRRPAWRSPIVWFGVIVTVVSLWYTLRGVPLGEVATHVRGANWRLLLAVALPANLVALWIRALRWRHLTDPIMPIATGPLFRATAVGFMANNIYPARAGEFVRAWYLGRETGADAAAVLATVVVERVIDSATFLPILAGTAWVVGTKSPALENAFEVGVPILVVVALLPLLLVIGLRVAPELAIRTFRAVAGRFLSARVTERAEELLRRFAEGLGSLRGGVHLFWIAWHSIVLWMVASVVPFVIGLYAMGIDLGSFTRNLEAAYTMLAFVGLAVALPSVPGFFGLYHGACTMALAVFGVPKDESVALGTVLHLTFWSSVTLLGLAVLRFGRTSLGTLEAAVDSGAADDDRAEAAP